MGVLLLSPTRPDDPESQANRDAWKVLMGYEKSWLCAFGDSDPITDAAAPVIQKLIPGCQGQAHSILRGGGRFIQEDCGEELSRQQEKCRRKPIGTTYQARHLSTMRNNIVVAIGISSSGKS